MASIQGTYDTAPSSGATGWGTSYVKPALMDLDDRALYALRPTARRPLNPPNRTIIFGGQTGHAYTSGGTNTTFNLNDTTDYVLGDRSMKATTSGAADAGASGSFFRKLSGTAVDFTNKIPEIWLKIDDLSKLSDLVVWLGSGGALANAFKWRPTDNATTGIYRSGEWARLTLPWSQQITAAGTPTRNALTDVNIQFFDNGTGALVVHFGGLSAVPDTTTLWPNGVVSLTFDDGLLAHYTQAKMYMDKYGFQGTCYPIIDSIGVSNHMSLAQLKALQTVSGWDVGLHSYTQADHDAGFTTLTAAALTQNIRRMREYLLANGIYSPAHLAYPLGDWNLSTEATLAPLVTSARTTNPKYYETWPPPNRMRLTTVPMSNTKTFANIQTDITNVKANKEWLILTFHDIVASAPASTGTTITIFQQIVDELNTQGVAVRTVHDVMAAQPGIAN